MSIVAGVALLLIASTPDDNLDKKVRFADGELEFISSTDKPPLYWFYISRDGVGRHTNQLIPLSLLQSELYWLIGEACKRYQEEYLFAGVPASLRRPDEPADTLNKESE